MSEQRLEARLIEIESRLAALRPFALSNIPIPDPSEKTRIDIGSLEERLRRELGSEITGLRELHEIKFKALETLIEHDAKASREAIAAALTSQREAAAKSESATGELLKALDRRVDEVKERLDTGEGVSRGSIDTRSERRQQGESIMSIAAVIMAAVSLLINAVLAVVALPHAAPVPVTVSTPPGVLK